MEGVRQIDCSLVKTILKRRDKNAHKGDFGTVLIVAGSKEMAGAGILCIRGALRSGAGLVRIAVPEELFSIMQAAVPEATCLKRGIPINGLSEYDAIVIGPGLGNKEENIPLLCWLFDSSAGTLILDADGLNLMARDKMLWDAVKRAGKRTILTPHPGEAARILGCSALEINADRKQAVVRLMEQTASTIVLKGAGTIVSGQAGEIYINTTGNPGMATGGSGDVLSGIIGSFSAQGMTCLNAALAGVFIHGSAGDLGAAALGEYGLIASDIAAMTGRAIMEIAGNQERHQEGNVNE